MDLVEKSLREDRYRYRREGEHPSFSATLLEAIYRSIDEGGNSRKGETTRRKQINCSVKANGVFDETCLPGACMIDQWMEKKVSEKVVCRRNSAADFEAKPRNHRESPFRMNSSSTSSDSSCGGGFSSSEAEAEAESVYGASSGSASCRPKPIRTCFGSDGQRQKPKHEGSFVKKSKWKASKIYGELKKIKQPISPGGRFASFLNSLFTAGNARKSSASSSAGGYYNENETISARKHSNSAQASSCSSASSFSRSCLSKTTPKKAKSGNGMKRSVRFHPMSVIVDEDNRPCGHKSLYRDESCSETAIGVTNSIKEELQLRIMEKHRRAEEAARDLLRNYQKKAVLDNEEEPDDDAESCASSDLFELDNLSAIGIQRYRDELPVYETTRLNNNRAITNGFML